ncbi:MAG TPA: hypothetical protein VER79_05580 [Candidatus Limnocylindrales bacterium]|nr:hypothetical protein [Candidatus Limnocylindrales bacterium]
MFVAQAIEAQSLFQHTLLNKPNVVGVAVGFKESNGVTTDQLAVVVLVEQKKPIAALSAQDAIPRELDGMRTDVVEVGYLRAQQTPKDRFRPVIPSGVSIGHYKVTAGTLGTIVKDRTTSELFILSNNHVLANCNDAVPGDVILQPGTVDGGINPGDVVAKLERFIKLGYIGDPVTPPTPGTPPPSPTPGPTPPPAPGGSNAGCLALVVALSNALAGALGSQQRVQTIQAASVNSPTIARASAQADNIPDNKVDCALARPIDSAMFSDDIRQIGLVNDTKAPVLGMRVRKYGRTTAYTEGNIKLLNATVNVNYSTMQGTRTARFSGQVIADGMSQGGDSGSLIVDTAEAKAVGLLFAGSELATIFTPIDMVLEALNITL